MSSVSTQIFADSQNQAREVGGSINREWAKWTPGTEKQKFGHPRSGRRKLCDKILSAARKPDSSLLFPREIRLFSPNNVIGMTANFDADFSSFAVMQTVGWIVANHITPIDVG